LTVISSSYGNTFFKGMNVLVYEHFKKKPKKNTTKVLKNTQKADSHKKRFIISFTTSFIALIMLLAFASAYFFSDIPSKNVNAGVSQNILSEDTQKRLSFVSFNMLIALNSSSSGKTEQFMLYRLDANKSRTVILPLPTKLEVLSDGSFMSLDSFYKKNGLSSAGELLSKNFLFNVDYTVEIDSDNFVKIFDKIGGLYADVPESFEFQTSTDSKPVILTKGRKQYISGDKVYALIAADYSADGEKLKTQTAVMKAFVTSKLTDFYMKDPTQTYGPIFNLVSTRFSMNELLTRSSLINECSDEKSVVSPQAEYETKTEGNGLYKLLNTELFEEYFKQ
jgi:anionic cell wall polymer biosynthesis LytR-Cps2A-Psr (LCP) family protein